LVLIGAVQLPWGSPAIAGQSNLETDRDVAGALPAAGSGAAFDPSDPTGSTLGSKPKRVPETGALPSEPGSTGSTEEFLIAVTVDDLPLQGPVLEDQSALSVTRDHLDMFRRHGVPEAVGFVNAIGLKDNPGGDAVLSAWVRAGHLLGNHTYSHMNMGKVPSLDAWIADVEANEPFLEHYGTGRDRRFFRLAFLATGNDAERRQVAFRYLSTRGYRIADASLSFSDWAFADAYVRCRARHDEVAIADLESWYFDGVERNLESMIKLSRAIYGRVIPQVLLIHLSAWSAHTLPKVLQRIEAAGGQYTDLGTALADPAYRLTPEKWRDGLMMEREATRLQMEVEPTSDQELYNRIDQLCRNNEK
jgi:peptidoglycan/xylan/chitin deacetylase (PgdA/CDA1 family)